MKIYKYIVAGFFSCMALTGCSDWLDIQPQDTTDEDQLFETGDGYRVALNGIYKQMASSAMYGKTLTWGAVDAMGQYYSANYATVEDYFADFNYVPDEVESQISGVWTTAYNSIANCNNLIQRVREASASSFELGQEEKDLILGEALALRAYLHFDLLRLFAPAMKLDDGGKYLPYVESYPITFQEYTTNTDFLDKVVRDLKEAKDLVGEYDIPRVSNIGLGPRFKADYGTVATDQIPSELFFAYRGYRLSYWAICAELARVYTYAGRYKEAFDETENVVDVALNDYGSLAFDFAYPQEGDTKLYSSLIFALSYRDLVEDYKSYITNYPLPLSSWDPSSQWFDGDNADYRLTLIEEDGYDYVSSKYLESSGGVYQYTQDMIPMLRLGEMYLIRAEYYNSIGNKEAAMNELATLRRGQNCSMENVDTEGDDWFETAVINEARREFIQEGQLFFYYKRLNVAPAYGISAEKFIWPYPDNEEL